MKVGKKSEFIFSIKKKNLDERTGMRSRVVETLKDVNSSVDMNYSKEVRQERQAFSVTQGLINRDLSGEKNTNVTFSPLLPFHIALSAVLLLAFSL